MHLAAVSVAGLIALSLYLAWSRFVTVDDFQNIYMARVLATGRQADFFTNAELYLLPLGWATRGMTRSADVVHASRLLAAGWFWLNLSLLVLACGFRLRSRRGLVALLGIGLTAPLWIHGYEVRHDNLLFTWLMAFWLLVRRPSPRAVPFAFTALGFLTVVAQFSDIKAAAYWFPCLGLALLFPNPALGRPRWRLSLELLMGFALGAGFCAAVYGLTGSLGTLVDGLHRMAADVGQTPRFGPGLALGMVLDQAPMLTGLFVVFVVLCFQWFHRDKTAFLSWSGWAPELVFVLIGIGVFLVNPNPYPYNLLLLVPQMLISAARLVEFLERGIPRELKVAVLWVLLLGMAIPFGRAAVTHLAHTNQRQLQLVALAEDLTDERADRVFDAIGMVPTRDSIGFYWLYNSMTIQRIRDGRLPDITEALRRNPPSVVLPNFRLTWLSASAKSFLGNHYLALAGDFLVLGGRLPAGGGTWTCLHGGRYAVLANGEGGAGLVVDGMAQVGDIVNLVPGDHTITRGRASLLVVWVGPRLRAIPHLEPSDENPATIGI